MLKTLTIDSKSSEVKFHVKHMMISKVYGSLGNVQGVLHYDEEHLSRSNILVTLDVSTINTKDKTRDDHLRGKDFLNCEKYPHISFSSSGFEKKGKELWVTGQLTIRDVTKQLTLQIKFPPHQKNNQMLFSGSTKINRKDFGLTWHGVLEAGGILVGEEIQINFEVKTL